MCSKGSSSAPPVPSSQSTAFQSATSPSAFIAPAYQSFINNAQSLATTPFNPAMQGSVAPMDPLQLQGGQQLFNLGMGLGTFDPSKVQSIESPFTQDVVQATQNQFNNQNAIQSNDLMSGAIKSGNAFGGDRAGIAEAQLAGQQQLAQAPVIAGLEQAGYGQALQEYNQLQQMGMAGAQAATGWGQALQQQAQRQLDVAQQNAMMQSAYPFQTQNWLASLLGGLGPLTGTFTQGYTTPPSPSALGQAAGVASSLVGLGSTVANQFQGAKRGGIVRGLARGGPVLRFQDGGEMSGLSDFSTANDPESYSGSSDYSDSSEDYDTTDQYGRTPEEAAADKKQDEEQDKADEKASKTKSKASKWADALKGASGTLKQKGTAAAGQQTMAGAPPTTGTLRPWTNTPSPVYWPGSQQQQGQQGSSLAGDIATGATLISAGSKLLPLLLAARGGAVHRYQDGGSDNVEAEPPGPPVQADEAPADQAEAPAAEKPTKRAGRVRPYGPSDLQPQKKGFAESLAANPFWQLGTAMLAKGDPNFLRGVGSGLQSMSSQQVAQSQQQRKDTRQAQLDAQPDLKNIGGEYSWVYPDGKITPTGMKAGDPEAQSLKVQQQKDLQAYRMAQLNKPIKGEDGRMYQRQADGTYKPVQITPEQQAAAQAPAQPQPLPPAPSQAAAQQPETEKPEEPAAPKPAWQSTKGTEGTGITATPIQVPKVSEETLSAFPKAAQQPATQPAPQPAPQQAGAQQPASQPAPQPAPRQGGVQQPAAPTETVSGFRSPLTEGVAERYRLTPAQFDMIAEQVAQGETFNRLGLSGKTNEGLRRELLARSNQYWLDQGMNADEAMAAKRRFMAMAKGAQTLGVQEARVLSSLFKAEAVAPRVLQASAALDRTNYPSLNHVWNAYLRGTGDEAVMRLGTAMHAMINNYAAAMNNGTAQLTDTSQRRVQELLSADLSHNQVRAVIEQMRMEMNSEARGLHEGLEAASRGKPPGPYKPLEQPGAPTTVQTPAEATKLTPGTRYRTPDGREFTR